MKSKLYLDEIRRAEGLSRAVLKKITVEGDEAVFHLVTDANYSREDVAYASEVSARYAPEGLRGSARVIKSVPSEEGIRRAVADILKTRFPALAAFVSPEDIGAEVDAGGGRFYLGVDASGFAKGKEDGVIDALSEELGRQFCGCWLGELRAVPKERQEIERELPPEEYIRAPRFFEIDGYSAVDGAAPSRAMYIADLTKEIANVTVCGTVSYIEERTAKNGKPYFSIALSDGTGTLRTAYFTRKATLEKVRAVRQGDSVCLTGDNELFNGGLSFRAKMLDYGAPPEGFTPVERPSRPVPAAYSVVFPVPMHDLVQAKLFDAAPLPEAVLKRDFVVFDLETTGLGNSSSAAMDRIIEIGAVKIAGGNITERFSSFVACPVRLPQEIIELTGITDEMLVGAPPVGAVMADFYKFAAGCALVGHNVQFDCKFIRYYGEKEGFLFDQRQYDTVTFAQEMLRLGNYKLNTVADHFGFEFHHHRAYDDAFVTAKIFLELTRMKNGLPR